MTAVASAPRETFTDLELPTRPSEGPAPTVATVHRVVSLLAVLGLLWPLFSGWSAIISTPQTGVAVIALTAGALILGCLIARAPDGAALARLDRWVLALGLLTIAARAAGTLAGSSGYSTDEAAFTHGAVNLMLHGHDPYGANLTGSLYAYSVPGKFWTYLMNGGYVTTFGYPALSLLLVTPFVWLTGDGQAVSIACIVCLMALTAIVYRLLPRQLRGLAVITCVGFPTLFGFAMSGLNVLLMLPFLVLALPRTGSGGEERSARRAIALGLAMSVNQLAWFLAPFVVVPGVVAAYRASGRGAAAAHLGWYARWAGGAFVLVNLPFVLASPGAWLAGALSPLTQHALPYGQGLVGLTAVLGIGGGAVDAYGIAGATLYVGLLVFFVWRIDELAPAALLLPLLALFISDRSLGEYWMALVPALALAVAARRAREHVPWPKRTPLILLGLFTPAAAALAVALLVPAPLTLRILSAQSDARTDGVTSVRMLVVNRSGRWMRPFYSTDSRGQASTFWVVTAGPRALPPHSRELVTLRVAESIQGPSNGAQFVVQAVTGSPRTISVSSRFTQVGEVPAQPAS